MLGGDGEEGANLDPPVVSAHVVTQPTLQVTEGKEALIEIHSQRVHGFLEEGDMGVLLLSLGGGGQMQPLKKVDFKSYPWLSPR